MYLCYICLIGSWLAVCSVTSRSIGQQMYGCLLQVEMPSTMYRHVSFILSLVFAEHFICAAYAWRHGVVSNLSLSYLDLPISDCFLIWLKVSPRYVNFINQISFQWSKMIRIASYSLLHSLVLFFKFILLSLVDQ